MRTFATRFFVLCAVGLCASCASQQPNVFQVRAINADEEEVPCVVLVDDQVLLDPSTNEPVRTPAKVELSFPTAPDGRRRSVKLGVRPIRPGGEESEGEGSGGILYAEDSRFVAPTDAPTQLFVLRRSRSAEP